MRRAEIISASDLEDRIERCLAEASSERIWVEGEIIQCARGDSWRVLRLLSPRSPQRFAEDPASGAAVVTAFIGARRLSAIDGWLRSQHVDPETFFRIGSLIRVSGGIEYRRPNQQVQLHVEVVARAAGRGALTAWRAEVRRQVEREGWLSAQRSRAGNPPPFARVAIVTTERSEALGDVRSVFRRAPDANIQQEVVAPERVEGPGASRAVADAIQQAARSNADAVVVTRGGGADPLANSVFDHPAVVRAIADSRLPVVVGIGHAQDPRTLAEEAAWRVAATPTAAADLVVASVRDARQRVAAAEAAASAARDRTGAALRRRFRRESVATVTGMLMALILAAAGAGLTQSWAPALIAVAAAAVAAIYWIAVTNHRRLRSVPDMARVVDRPGFWTALDDLHQETAALDACRSSRELSLRSARCAALADALESQLPRPGKGRANSPFPGKRGLSRAS